MKYLIAFLVLTLLSQGLMAKGTPTPISSLSYVYATSGLNLRTTPETNGQIIKIIPYGDKVEIVEHTDKQQQIEWIEGIWVKVKHEGNEGYLFNGFLSTLPLPSAIDGTTTRDDHDLTYPLINWLDLNYGETQVADTLVLDNSYSLTKYLEGDNWYSQTDGEYRYRLNVLLKNTKPSEAHHLLKSMLQTKAEREVYEEKSVYLSNDQGQIHKIRIELDQPVQVSQVSDTDVLITVTSYHSGCNIY